MITILNLTPHTVTVLDSDNGVRRNRIRRVYSPSGDVARVASTARLIRHIDGVPVVRREYGEVTGLPDPAPDTVYIVSRMVVAALAGSGRSDLIVPDDIVRDAAGDIIGCRQFSE